MKNTNRTFTVLERGQGQSGSTIDISLSGADKVEVMDVLTRSVMCLSAADVSIYRHTLHLDGKTFSLMNVRESV